MVRACVYPGCPVKQKRWETSFHRFPLRDPERTRMWLLALRLDINTPRARVRDLRVCGQHFKDEDYNIRTGALRTTLKSTAVPSPVSHTEQNVKMDTAGDVEAERLPVDELRHLSPGTDTGDRRYSGYQFPPKLLVTTPQRAKSRIPQRTPSTSGVYKVFPPTRSQPETADCESHLSSCQHRVPAVSSASPEGSSYAILNKEVLLLLMFRCLECSSECRIRGIGKGGSLSLGQECLSCSNYRLWTSRQAEKPKEKTIDAAFIPVYENVFTQTSGNPSLSSALRSGHGVVECKSDAMQEKSDTDSIASVIVKEEWEDCDEEVKEEQESLLTETYKGYASVHDGVGAVKDETDEFMPYEDLDFQTVTLLIDETGRVMRAELPRDAGDEEDLEENSKSDEDSSFFHSLEDLKEQSSDLDSFQNIIKPVIWCTDCTDIAKMICTIRRHRKIYGCAECGGNTWEENSTSFHFKNVHFSDIMSFHKHAIKEHGAQEIPPDQNRVSKKPHKTIRMSTDLNKKQKEHVMKPGEKPSTILKNHLQKHHHGDGNTLGEEDQSIDDSSGTAKRPGRRARKASDSDEEWTKRGRRKKARRKRKEMILLHAE